MNEKTILRYLKVKALADGGQDGEKDSARTILTRLEGQYPGIREAAAAYATRQEAPAREPVVPRQRGPGWRSRVGNWEEIFRYAAGVYQTVQEVVEDVSDAYYGQTLAEEDVIFSGGTRKENVFVRMKMSFETLHEARALNVMQQEAFRQALHAKLDGYLDSLLQE